MFDSNQEAEVKALMNASFEEKSAWITMLALLGTFGFYFFVAGRMLAHGVTAVAAFVPLFALVVGLLVVVLVVAHTVVAIASRPDGRDERDQVIAWRAENNSSWLLGVGVIGAIFGLATPLERVWIANGLLLSLFLSEVLKYALQLYYYRRGM